MHIHCVCMMLWNRLFSCVDLKFYREKHNTFTVCIVIKNCSLFSRLVFTSHYGTIETSNRLATTKNWPNKNEKRKPQETKTRTLFLLSFFLYNITFYFLTERSPVVVVVMNALYMCLVYIVHKFCETRFFFFLFLSCGAQETNGYRMMKIISMNTDYMLVLRPFAQRPHHNCETIRSIRRFSPKNSQRLCTMCFICMYVCMHGDAYLCRCLVYTFGMVYLPSTWKWHETVASSSSSSNDNIGNEINSSCANVTQTKRMKIFGECARSSVQCGNEKQHKQTKIPPSIGKTFKNHRYVH